MQKKNKKMLVDLNSGHHGNKREGTCACERIYKHDSRTQKVLQVTFHLKNVPNLHSPKLGRIEAVIKNESVS